MVDQRRRGHLVLVGATASGKSQLALEVARRRPGTELVSVDSMAVYRSMNVGTATPSVTDRNEVPHHLLDLVEPTEEFTVSMFQAAAFGVLDDLDHRRCRSILVGGTGLHVRAVVDELAIPPRFPDVRAELEVDRDTGALYRRLVELDAKAAARMEPTNRRRILRALEVTVGAARPFSSFGPGLSLYPPTPFTQIGIRIPRAVLDRRILERYWHQMKSGFLEEVIALNQRLEPLSATAAQALGYRELLAHLHGDCGLEEAVESAVAATRRFARRQDRWFRRDPRIDWIEVDEDPLEALPEVLERFDRSAPDDTNRSSKTVHRL
ncbi:MAG: tRNA (adenosine(37)-N6)-dimethylallyltransferase MiaA [Actinomycetota bacterium]|nr:tRNA (adenosine(37)-N6)-dimethylallyltransferase MiaA [Actinomycetota bacterium]